MDALPGYSISYITMERVGVPTAAAVEVVKVCGEVETALSYTT